MSMPIYSPPRRRMRLLQYLSVSDWPIGAPLLLTLLRGDTTADLADVLRALIWLEDAGLADVRTIDVTEHAVVHARITPRGREYLAGDDVLRGIERPGGVPHG